MKKIVLAVDLGGTNIRVAAINEEGIIERRVKRLTPVQEGCETVFRHLLSSLNEVSSSFDKKQICGVGMGIAGVIDIEKGIVTQSPNLLGFDGYPIKAKLIASFSPSLPTVIDNDANMAAMGEKWKGAGIGVNNLLCLTLGTGIGGGIIIQGKILHGADGMAGELGHIIVDPQGAKCGCGNNGCLEALATGSAIKREAIKALPRHPESEIYKRCEGKIENVTPEIVYQSAQASDPLAQKIYQEMGRYLGIGIASLINIFNPEMVIIGGGVSKAWEVFSPATRKEVQMRALRIPALRARLVPANCPDDAGLFGAAYSVFKYIDLLD